MKSFPLVRLLLGCFVAILQPGSTGVLRAATSQVSEVEKASEIHARLEAMEKTALDLGGVRATKSSIEKRAASRKLLQQVIAAGHPVLAQHAIGFLSYRPSRAFVPAVLERQRKVGNTWPERHLRVTIADYLARLGDAENFETVVECMQDEDFTFRLRAYRLLRDFRPETIDPRWSAEITQILRQAVDHERDPSALAAALAALSFWDSADAAAAAVQNLEILAKGESSRMELRAAVELNQLRLWAETKVPREEVRGELSGLSDGYESFLERLEALATDGAHDERIFAVELLAQAGTPATDRRLKSLGSSASWKDRLQSAYYLLLTGDTSEAALRIQTESHPFVQLALLCGLAVDEP